MTYTPTLIDSTIESVGTWRIDTWRSNTPGATLGLRDLKAAIKTELPLNIFTFSTYANADPDIIGKPIPVAFGVVKGAKAHLINTSTNTFKVLDHAVSSFTSHYTSDRTTFSPDSTDLDNAEFVYAAHDDKALYVDLVATYDNPVDVVELLLTDSTRGVSLSSALLDTTSFGSSGARTDYLLGYNADTLAEVSEFPISLYLNIKKEVFNWIQRVLVSSFGILYINRAGKYKIRAWKPSVGEDALEITEANVINGEQVDVSIISSDPITQVIAEYDKVHGLDSVQTTSHADDELRQLRGLTGHVTLQKTLDLSGARAALYWAERTVAMRGVPRRVYTLPVTQEFSQLEPGDTIRVNYTPLDLDEICEVLEVTISPGTMLVWLRLSDVRGFRDGPGFWVGDSPAFPDGGSITNYDDADTETEREWIRENVGIWTDDNGYADDTVPLLSYRLSRWI